ncbi:MAG: peptidylprolyl isomerase [Candidatus Polarisedimenticolia bacterium]
MRSRALLAAFVAAAFLLPAWAAKDKESAGDASPVVATINGEPVTKAEWSAIWKADQWHAETVKKHFSDKMAGKPYEDYFFMEEVVKVRSMSQKYREDVPQMKTAIEGIHQKVKGGDDFVALAKQYSQDTLSAADGGDLGLKEFHQLTFPFNRVAFSLKQGEVSDPVLTIFGYHVIKAEQVLPASPSEGKEKRVQVRHILIKFPSSNPRGEADTLASQAKVEVQDKGLCKKLPSFCAPQG